MRLYIGIGRESSVSQRSQIHHLDDLNSRCSGSEIVHLDVLGMHAIVVNSAKAAREIFEKRSLLYSDRFNHVHLF